MNDGEKFRLPEAWIALAILVGLWCLGHLSGTRQILIAADAVCLWFIWPYYQAERPWLIFKRLACAIRGLRSGR